MSTLVAQTISNGTVSTSSANVIQGSAKAWVNFNGTGTVAIRASYNVSSITDGGTGTYTVNFTNAFADADYASVLGTNAQESIVTLGGATTTSTTIQTFTAGGVAADASRITLAIFR